MGPAQAEVEWVQNSGTVKLPLGTFPVGGRLDALSRCVATSHIRSLGSGDCQGQAASTDMCPL